MVSKLALATQECFVKSIFESGTSEVTNKLMAHYYEINEGIGVHKPPKLYGAFSTDAYSHTPASKGAKQPGMTGQVKEDILIRFTELGVTITDGEIVFQPYLLQKNEFLTQSELFHYISIQSDEKTLTVEKNSLCYTYCQIPVMYKLSDKN